MLPISNLFVEIGVEVTMVMVDRIAIAEMVVIDTVHIIEISPYRRQVAKPVLGIILLQVDYG